MQANRIRPDFSTGELLIFPASMKKPPATRKTSPNQPPSWWQRYGNTAQWIAPSVAVLSLVLNTWVSFHNHKMDSDAKTSDEHVNSLIDARLNPAIEKIDNHIDAKIDPLIQRADALSDRVSHLEGARGIADVPELRRRFETTIAETKSSLDAGKPGIPKDIKQQAREIASALVNVKMPEDVVSEGVSALVHVAAYDYFTQEFPSHPPDLIINRFHLSGGALEAIRVRHPGMRLIADEGEIMNLTQDLSGVYWIHTTFENSVIVYNGGPLYLADVTFKNCTFDFGNDSQSREVKAALLGTVRRNRPSTLLLAEGFSSLNLRPDTATKSN